MNYYYSQQYGGYANYGIGEPTMKQAGCVITALAMILSYFNNRAFYPEQMLSWGRKNGMIDSKGRTRFEVFPRATNNKLRISVYSDCNLGESVYGIREVKLNSGQLHWVIDHPEIPNTIIDPLDGKVKTYNSQNYTGRRYFYIGKK
jgi:hypothetical protein